MSSTASSSQQSGRAHSPSPSPRSLRFAGVARQQQQQPLASTSSASFLPVPPTAHIPHSQADLDRLQMERALEELSMMSSSRASSSYLSRAEHSASSGGGHSHHAPSLNHRRPTANESLLSLSHDDFGSSVEFARANSPHGAANLSAAQHGRRSSNGGSSFNTTGGGAGGLANAPSPVSTNGHHASAITLRTGLVGSGLPTSTSGGRAGGPRQASAGFDDERELGKMLGGGGARPAPAVDGVFTFGLSDLGYGFDEVPPTPKTAASATSIKARTKLADALGRTTSSFSPRASSHHHHPARVASPLRTEESLFTTLARTAEDQLLVHRREQQYNQPLREMRSPAQGEGAGIRRSTSGGGGGGNGKKKRPMTAAADSPVANRRPSQQAARARAVSGAGGQQQHQQPSLYLPDVTGLSEAVGETPLRPARRPTVQEGREPAQRYPLPELSTLQTRLLSLEAENAQSHRRIATLESELRLTRERAEAAREEWAIERERLGRDQQRDEGEGEWERRYYEVVEQKKDLEALVASLRSQVVQLQTDLAAQQAVVSQLQAQRQADQAELTRRGREVDRLRDEVRSLSNEVGGLRRAFEEGRAEGRQRTEAEAQTSPRLWEQQEQQQQRYGHAEQADGGAYRRPADTQGLGFAVGGGRADLSVVQEETHADRPRRAEDRRSARTSPVERPVSRLSDGLRMAAAGQHSPPLPPSSPRMASVLPPPSPRPRSRFSTAAAGSRPTSTATAPHLYPLPPSPPSAWAASFEQEEPVLDLDEETEVLIPEGDLVDLREDDHGRADETVRPVSPSRPRVRSSSGQRQQQQQQQQGQSARQCQSSTAAPAAAVGGADRLPPQTVLARVLRELEDDYAHYKTIYVELADQYKLIDAASNVAKRNVLAEHLREVIDTLEQKGDQIASLYSLLTFADRPLPATSPAAFSAAEQKAFRSVKDLLRSVQEHDLGGRKSGTSRRRKD